MRTWDFRGRLLLSFLFVLLLPLAAASSIFLVSWLVRLPVSEYAFSRDLTGLIEARAIGPVRGLLPLIARGDAEGEARLEEMLKPVLVETGGEIQVIDLSGLVLFEADAKGFSAKTDRISEEELGALRPGIAILGFDRASYVWELYNSGRYSGLARLEFSINRVSGGFRSIAGRYLFAAFIAGALAFMVVLAFVSLRISQGILLPLKELASAMAKVAEGNLDFKIEYRGDDELGGLCESFETMRLRLKESLLKQKNEESDRRQMIASISHDLKTPLTSIKGYVEGLRDGIADDKASRDRYLAVIRDKTEKLDHLIEDLFRMSRFDLDSSALQTEEVFCPEALETLIEPAERDLRQSGFSFTAKRPFPECRLKLDLHRMGQVIDNIVQNAKRYLPEAGVVYFKAEIEGVFLAVSISDSGSGIRPEDLPRVFEPFYRGDKARSGSHEGTGLGLAICKRIVELHGGRIRAESSPGSGATFVIDLPII